MVDKVTTDGYKFVMDDGGWLLVRFSGTEPLIRVYTETTDQDSRAGDPGRRAAARRHRSERAPIPADEPGRI